MTKGLANKALLLLAIMSSMASAATLRVPQTYPSIQSAVDAARPNDTVLVSPGTYFENVRIDKPLKLLSTQGAARTIVDANHYRSALTIRGNNLPTQFVTVSGFTFTHGEFTFPPTAEFPDPTGTGIDAAGMNVFISHNVIEDNLSCEAGLMVFSAAKISVTDNVVRNNSGNWVCAFRGQGIAIGGGFDFDAEAIVERNDVYGNAGTGIGAAFFRKLKLRFNHSHHNGGTGAVGPGIAIDTVAGEITNNIVDHNTSARGSAMTLTMSTDDPIPTGLTMLVANNSLLHNDPTLLNDGEPNDGSVVVIDSYVSGIKFVANTVITATPAPLIYCVRERENAYPVFLANILSNNAGVVFSEDCHRP